MRIAWHRDRRVNIEPFGEDAYDRIRPQGGRSLRAFQSLCGEYCRDSGERNRDSSALSQRRSRARGASALLESIADGGEQAVELRGLSGNTTRQDFLSGATLPKLSKNIAIGFSWLLLLLSILLLSGCGGKKTQVQVPPPPPISQPSER